MVFGFKRYAWECALRFPGMPRKKKFTIRVG